MKKLPVILFAASMLLGAATASYGQDAAASGSMDSVATEEVSTTTTTSTPADNPMQGTDDGTPLHEQIKTKFIEGGPMFMGVILLLLILGLAIAIERIS